MIRSQRAMSMVMVRKLTYSQIPKYSPINKTCIVAKKRRRLPHCCYMLDEGQPRQPGDKGLETAQQLCQQSVPPRRIRVFDKRFLLKRASPFPRPVQLHWSL
jgi:hypothetical protein